MTIAVLLRSGMKRNFHVPFWRAVEKVTSSLTLILLSRALKSVGLIDSACGGLGVAQPLKQETSRVRYELFLSRSLH